jgi:hypothetical protein
VLAAVELFDGGSAGREPRVGGAPVHVALPIPRSSLFRTTKALATRPASPVPKRGSERTGSRGNTVRTGPLPSSCNSATNASQLHCQANDVDPTAVADPTGTGSFPDSRRAETAGFSCPIRDSSLDRLLFLSRQWRVMRPWASLAGCFPGRRQPSGKARPGPARSKILHNVLDL